VLQRFRQSYPQATLIAWTRLLRALSHQPDILPSAVPTSSISPMCALSARGTAGVDAIVHLAAISNDPMGKTFETSRTTSTSAPASNLRDKAKVAG